MIPPRAILAAADFSDTSRAALVLAARLARHGMLRRSDISVLVVPTGWTAPPPTASDLSGVGPVVGASMRRIRRQPA